jgi:hypothetical protein
MDNKQYEMVLEDAEIRLDRLKALYEQWFQGIERLEPSIPRKNLDRQVALLRREKPRNSRLRFRFQTLIQRYTTYITYWQRTARQIEEGTYRRDILRVRRQREEARKEREIETNNRRAAKRVASAPPDAESSAAARSDALIQSETNASPVRRPASAQPRAIRPITPFALPSIPAPDDPVLSHRPPSLARSSKTPSDRSHLSVLSSGILPAQPEKKPVARSDDSNKPLRQAGLWQSSSERSQTSHPKQQDFTDKQIRELYDRYLYARIKNKEPTETIKIEKLAKSVREMIPKLRKKHGGKNIDFQVVIKNGRVALKPVVK